MNCLALFNQRSLQTQKTPKTCEEKFSRKLFPRKIKIHFTDSETNRLRTVLTMFDKFSSYLRSFCFFGQLAKFKPSLEATKIEDNKVHCKAAGARCNFVPQLCVLAKVQM